MGGIISPCVITPHTMADTSGSPLFYMAGPMEYNANWQDDAMEHVLRNVPGAFVATPREVKSSRLLGSTVKGMHDGEKSQRPWENIMMRRAMETKPGCLIFWLPAPNVEHTPKGYAKTTRLELGETIGRIETLRELGDTRKMSVVFGCEDNFPGLGPILTDLRRRAGNPVIYKTLQETCDAAIEMAAGIC